MYSYLRGSNTAISYFERRKQQADRERERESAGKGKRFGGREKIKYREEDLYFILGRGHSETYLSQP